MLLHGLSVPALFWPLAAIVPNGERGHLVAVIGLVFLSMPYPLSAVSPLRYKHHSSRSAQQWNCETLGGSSRPLIAVFYGRESVPP
jgi:uncharacterized membrane protein